MLALVVFLSVGSAHGQDDEAALDNVFGSAPKAEVKKERGQSGVIGPEGGTVYVSPDFDSSVQATLEPGQKVVISRRRVMGRTGLGSFYRVKYQDKKLGYVADTEVIPEFQSPKGSGVRPKKNPVFNQVEEMRERARLHQEPIYLTRFLGLGVGSVDFSEKFSGRVLHAQTTTFNLRFTGPGVLFDGPPLDLQIAFSPKVPSYYEKFAQTPPTGFFLTMDLSLLLPLVEWSSFLIYYGLGPTLTFTKFNVQVNYSYINSQELRFGAQGLAGGAYRFRHWLLRGDAKYYFEKTQYIGYSLALQHEY